MTRRAGGRPGSDPRILHICTRYQRGGSERRLLDLMVAVPEFEHDVIVGLESDRALAAAQLPAATITVEPALLRQVSPVNDLRAIARVSRAIRCGRYSLVVTHQSKGGVVGRAAALLAHRPPVVHSLSMASFGPGYPLPASLVFQAAERALAPFTARYAVVGRDLARRYRDLGIPPAKFQVVRSGVPLAAGLAQQEARSRVEGRFGLPVARPLIAYVGSLDERKGVWDLVDLFERVAAHSPGPFLAIAGSGPLEERLRAAFAAAGRTEDVALLGYVSPVVDLIAAADVVVLLSRAEGVSQVLVQAASAGSPFVAYDVDGTNELVELGATGTIVTLGDVAGAAAATAALITSGQRGRPIDGRPWSPEAITSGYRAVVEGVLERTLERAA
ncbi:MAG TPA: glycosyltransferase [Acidimicrobiales bacterium]|nr:glycosyltransferase [Acidimicrobiales bacterium]